MTLGFAMCGSFCTYSDVFPIMEQLAGTYNIVPIFSYNASSTDNRFGKAQSFLDYAEAICKNKVIATIRDAEPIGPKKLLDILLIAPCTGNTLGKLANGIADTPVTMAVKSHLRNNGPVVIAVSTNDGLSGNAKNIGILLNRKQFYFVPFKQDNPVDKPSSLVADFLKIPDTLSCAVNGAQIQPILTT